MLRRLASAQLSADSVAAGPSTGGAGCGVIPLEKLLADTAGSAETAAVLRTTGFHGLSRLDGRGLVHWQRQVVAELLAGLPAGMAGRIRQLVCVTQTPDRLIPTAAAVLRPELVALGVSPDHQVDLSSGCSGYVDALRLLEANLAQGDPADAGLGLVISGDLSSRLIDRSDHQLVAVFGDGVAADLFELAGAGDVPVPGGHWRQVFAPAPWEALQRREGEPLTMDGLAVMNFVFASVVPCLLDQLPALLADQDPGRCCLVLHQANRFIVAAVEKRVRHAHPGLRLAGFRLGDVGNPGSASIPMALDRARQSGDLEGVERVIVCGFGVGLSCHVGMIAL